MFHFTIRDVLWLTTLAAVLVAWWIDHTKTRIDWQQVRTNEQRRIEAEQKSFWAEMRADAAQKQKASIYRAADRRGVSILDLEAETRIQKPFLDDNE